MNFFVNFVKDYYNGANESGDDSDNPGEKTVISVAAGQTVENVDLISNETVNDLDALGDDDEMTFEFPSGFSFPFFGKTYTEVVVNSDGNLTFGGGDSRPGAARSEQRFLSGLPRIAPLFADLDPGQPGDGKDVKATTSDTEVTFSWENVPEFSSVVPRPGNLFSVTLFSNGDILFKYVSVNVTPDFPESDNLQAIVGVTPGNSAPGSLSDLSTEEAPIGINGFAVYEVFKGLTYDLNGMQILFSPSGTAQMNTVDLLFPFYQGNSEDFTGYAVTNFSTIGAGLQVEGWGTDGTLLSFPDNPHSESVGGLEQMAKLGSEFFGTGFSTLQQGWVRICSDRPDVASFFQFGNGLSGPLTQMDGSVAFKDPSNVLFFTRLYEGQATFPSNSGFQAAETILHIANPNAEEIALTFKLFNPTGTQIGADVKRTLGAQGMLFESVTSLFGLQLPVGDGFVQVDASGAGAVGFELIRLADAVLGLNASSGNSTSRSYSVQLAHGTAGGVSLFTSLKVVNTANEPRAFTVTAYNEDGTEIRVLGPFPLNAGQNLHQTFQEDLGQILGLGFNPGPPTAGSILIQADGPGLIGDVIFGDPIKANFAAALPLQTVLFTKAIFGQVGQRISGSDGLVHGHVHRSRFFQPQPPKRHRHRLGF